MTCAQYGSDRVVTCALVCGSGVDSDRGSFRVGCVTHACTSLESSERCVDSCWRDEANRLQTGNPDANVTFDHHKVPKVAFTFAFPGLRAVC